MNVLLTGCDGYIGSVLAPLLLGDGHNVIGVDSGFYRQAMLFTPPWESPRRLTKDIRDLLAADLEGIEAVVHLAELSNDPLGQNDPAITYEINHLGSLHLARIAKAAGVHRFVYTSSCSVYGAAGEGGDKTEESSVNPQTAYAECKVLVERDVAQLADASFSPIFLRNATAFGASPHMRFDIVLNDLCGLAWTTKEIKMKSDGTPWRPLVHVRDICDAIRLCIQADRDVVHNEIFNVGSDDQNYRIREVAEIVAQVFPGCTTSFGDLAGDNRSYKVSFAKIRKHLPTFTCKFGAAEGASELYETFSRIGMTPEMFQMAPFTRLKQLNYLLKTGQLDRSLRWVA